MVISDNRYLTIEEMTINAQYIMEHLLSKGWTKESIAGMLGNMQTESTINPGIWQNLDSGNMAMGFGLVQWTPASKYTSWADSYGYSWTDINGQLTRLQFEIDNNLQWIATSEYPLSFQEFKTSSESPEYLAQAFLKNYERPANQNQPNRSTQARYWYDVLSGEGVSYPAFPTTEGLPISSKYGWRVNPITGQNEFHAAIDISGQQVKHPIYATQSGTVIYNQFTDYGGWTIRIQHTGDKYFSQYQHMDIRSPIAIGESVTKGQDIGVMGTTGDSTGIHLDFMIATRIDGWFKEDGTMDPEVYLNTPDGGGVNPPEPPNGGVKASVALLLCDALNGWKW